MFCPKNKNFLQQNKKTVGFTLVELLVVIAIIGILSSMAVINLNNARAKARDARRKDDIKKIMLALEMYYNDNGEYPASGGANAPNSSWNNSGDASWDTLQLELNSYLTTLPKDPINDPANDTLDWAYKGKYNYGYFSLNYGCNQQWYMLVYKLENPDITSPGITSCDGTVNNYSGTITIGMCPGCQ